MRMRLSVLGQVELHLDGRPVVLAPMQQRLLAVLAVRVNRPVSRHMLAAELWDDAPPATVMKALSWHITRLRKLLGDADRVGWGSGGYTLRLEQSEVDSELFESRYRDGIAAADGGDPHAAGELFAEGLALWRGPAYSGLTEAGLLRQDAARLEQLRWAALERRCAAELQLGRHAELIAELSGLVAEAPFRETLREQLMLALYRSGRQADALEVYRDGKVLLSEELGMDPGPALAKLERQILSADPLLLPPRAVDPDTEPRAAQPVRAAVRQLPRQSGDIVGREDVRHAIDAIADSDPGAVVAITGMAGVGKTSLAVSWAHKAVRRFPDGQLYAGLRGFGTGPPADPREVLARFLRALGVGAADLPEDLDTLTDRYRSLLADRKALVLLDDAADAAQLRPLLPGGPDCLVLVTSRNSLSGLVALDGAQRVGIDVLSEAAARGLLRNIIGGERIDAEPEAADALARQCGRLPLALRITAANLSDHPQRRIADQVRELSQGHRLADLAVSGDSAAAVAPTFDMSYRRLSTQAQTAYRLLGRLPSVSFGVAATAAATGFTVPEAETAVAQLSAAHLIEPAEDGRYRFHDLVRVHARRRCEATDRPAGRDAAVARWLDWYLRCASAAADSFGNDPLRLPLPAAASTVDVPAFDTAEQAADWLTAEQSNLLAACHTAAEQDSDSAWLLADALRGHFAFRSEFQDWEEATQAGLRVARARSDLRAQAAMNRSLGWRARELGDHDIACDHYRDMLEYARTAGDTEWESAALVGIASSCFALGRLSQAAEHCAEAVRIIRDCEAVPPLVVVNILGITTRELGLLDESAEILRAGVAETRHTNDGDLHVLLTNLAATYLDLGELDRAQDCLTEALALSRGLGAVRTTAAQLENLARVHVERGDLAEARSCARQALQTADELGLTTFQIYILNTLATTESDPAAVTELASRALDLAERLDLVAGKIEAHLNLSRAHRLARAHDKSIDHAERARVLARDTEHRVLEGRALTALAHAQLDAEDFATARSIAQSAADLHQANGSRLWRDHALTVLAEATAGTPTGTGH